MPIIKKTLLIVDDEPSICLILEHYFGADYKVVVKSNGLEAMQWLEQGNSPDAIVADYDMPVMDGPDFIKQIRASSRHRDVGLIILSGKESTSNKILCLRLGADDYLVKPFNPEELSLRIQNLLNRIRV
ncbi:response regulator transcription factor [Hymenobacter arizonensis]|jgi:DNA-binding response OmpR family regulator|uniref:Response regulator receiver domain-containing protein n=2 Tax=Hymenobacter arizonensis TaxID=1227077 RepID=A0A1I5Z6L8_HYMAR|nr:response regulator [Hymenobacter arizonensis]SFQ52116.1 Response regulator receiver domain-containing protein [Hymenobacter arizonensis]